MAFQAKFTLKRGRAHRSDVAMTAGSAEAQSDTISINLDVTSMGKGEALRAIESIRDAIHSSPWPPL